jgi:hypothetical protein
LDRVLDYLVSVSFFLVSDEFIFLKTRLSWVGMGLGLDDLTEIIHLEVIIERIGSDGISLIKEVHQVTDWVGLGFESPNVSSFEFDQFDLKKKSDEIKFESKD